MKLSLTVLFLLLLGYATPAFSDVTVTIPRVGAQVSSPFALIATASPCNSQAIASMGYSLDDSSNTTIVNGASVNAQVSASIGAHTLHVKSWGDQGASCVTDVAITVVSLSSITVTSPSPGAQVSSPFALQATAEPCSSQAVSAMGYSLDNSTNTTIVYATYVNAEVSASVGTHTLHVKSWSNQGASCVADVPITVLHLAAPKIPSNAIAVHKIQNGFAWQAASDNATGSGLASGTTALVSSPSLSGAARQFVTTYRNSGGERYWASFGADPSATNFVYDAQVYLAAPSSDIANIEMDMNQVMSNGVTVIFGFQCDGYTGTWDYTENAGATWNPVDQWRHSSAPCNPRNWATNTWHHVQVSYSRDGEGNVTYESVWLDGVQQQINETVPSAFALGWGSTLLTNFQIDGLGGYGSATVYLDKLTVYRW